jgi:transposase
MALSLDLRQRIIKAYEEKQGSVRQLAKRFAVGEASVWRLVSRYQRKGEIEPKKPPGRNKTVLEKHELLLKKWLMKENDLTLEELRQRLSEEANVHVSVVTIHRACHRLEIRYKKNGFSS